MIVIRVPASTANLGPGFDCLGAALDLFNEFVVEPAYGVHEFYWYGSDKGQSDDDNLVLKALRSVFSALGRSCPGVRIRTQRCDIPMNSGLGSSASAIVAGLLAGNTLVDSPLSQQELLNLAVAMEGHPDNVMACLQGGIRAGVVDEQGNVTSAEIRVAEGLQFAVLVPAFGMSTARARAVLPGSYSIQDAVHNISRVGLLITAMVNGEFGNLRLALQDRMHQPQRLPLIPEAVGVMKVCQSAGSYGEYISGAGPAIVALMPAGDQEGLQRLRTSLAAVPGEWCVYALNVWQPGAIVEVNG